MRRATVGTGTRPAVEGSADRKRDRSITPTPHKVPRITTTDATTATAIGGAARKADGTPGRRWTKGLTGIPRDGKLPAWKSTFGTGARSDRPARTVCPTQHRPSKAPRLRDRRAVRRAPR